MNGKQRMGVGLLGLALVGAGQAQSGAAGSVPAPGGAAKVPVPAAAPAPAAGAQSGPALRLQTLDPATRADPFPAVNPKNFTAASPTPAEVESYLHAMLGYDTSRLWRVEGIQSTAAPGISRVTALVTDRAANAKVLTAVFFVTPDGKHLIAEGSGVQPFGANPFAANRALLQARADGPARGAAAKDLLLVEFADLQCPHCKDAEAVMTRLAGDFPKARVVYQSFPLVEIHPFAFQAAAYGACVGKTSNAAFFSYAQAVYDTQAGLTAAGAEKTLKDAVVKAGGDPAAVAACAGTAATKDAVNASAKLATDVGIDQTPTLVVNGRLLPVMSIPYETLKSIIVFQAGLDGVSGAAASANNLTLRP